MVWRRLNALNRVLVTDMVHDFVTNFGSVVGEQKLWRTPAIYNQVFECLGYGRAVRVPSRKDFYPPREKVLKNEDIAMLGR